MFFRSLYPFAGSIVLLGLLLLVYAIYSNSFLIFAEGAYLTYFGIFLTMQLWQDGGLQAREITHTHQSITRL